MNDVSRNLPPVDVCIVGGGPAGMATARALASAGRTVALLESGGLRSSPEAQQLNRGEYVGGPYQALDETRHRGVGGTAHIWTVEAAGHTGAKFVPLDPRDFRTWPIAREDLEPYYHQAQAVCGLGRFDYRADGWTTPERQPFDLTGTGLTNGIYQFGYATRFTRDVAGEIARSPAITFIPEATVTELVRGPGRRLSGVRAARSDREAIDVHARAVILACGAVENARMLLRHLEPDAGSPWLGRGFMEHGRDFSLVLVPREPELFARASFYDQYLSSDGVLVGGRIAPTDEVLDSFDLPNASMTLVPRERKASELPPMDRAARWIRRMVGEDRQGRYGWSTTRAPERRFDAFRIVLNFEHDPAHGNRIELSDTRDRFGIPLPRLTLAWTDEEQARLERFRRLIGEWFGAAGIGHLRIREGRRPDLRAHHHAGTTRMGLSPGDGVVDRHGRVFGVDNLYIGGASVFPTAGFANPTLTIVAMALRLARDVDDALG